MSRIGKKPIAVPQGVKVQLQGNVVAVQGPKGKLETIIPAGIKFEQTDGHLQAFREDDSKAALHGLARALVNNAVEGVTKGWVRELEIVGVGYGSEEGYYRPEGWQPASWQPHPATERMDRATARR